MAGLRWSIGGLMLILGLGGCAETSAVTQFGVGAGAASFYTLGVNKKLPTDVLASAVTGRDCSIVTYEKTGYYCPPNIVVDRSKLYCHQTLGGVDCYDVPDPYLNGNRPIGSPPPRRVITE